MKSRDAKHRREQSSSSKSKDSKRAKQKKLKAKSEEIHVRVNRARAMTTISMQGHNVNSKITTEPAKKQVRDRIRNSKYGGV